MARSEIIIPQGLLNLDRNIIRAVEDAVEDCTDDLLRVATLRTPVDSRTLEQNGTSNVDKSGNKIVGQVSFSAINKGFNYAKKMNEGKYNLGEKSLTKSARGVRSKFTQATMNVGSGYLDDTAQKCQKGYTDYINYKIYDVIAKDGFNVFKK
ncbi:hypothetical protein [uncultured Clostridium sp.]|uniref:hypothetical protein n=1 Tax=uncultured Clostridium sp. TaxID=59620 RepID=UPI0026F3A975|nr:hypothetical protein [uncultured Clostridium sp.]